MENKLIEDLVPGYLLQEGAANYLCTTERKIALFRKYKLLKATRLGKSYVYRREWLDDFMEQWAGFDLSNEARIRAAISEKAWREKHKI